MCRASGSLRRAAWRETTGLPASRARGLAGRAAGPGACPAPWGGYGGAVRFAIRHHTVYRYTVPVQLGPQRLRFRPRDDGAQRVLDYRMRITPSPAGANEHLEPDGNRVTQAWFAQPTERLEVEVEMRVETLRRNPFDFVLAPEALRLPIGTDAESASIRACLERPRSDEGVTALARELRSAVRDDTLAFLQRLNRFVFEEFEAGIRDEGAARSPGETLAARRGACRDLAVLFIDGCRAAGVPARFASGYQRGHGRLERRYLHAWPEVYLPGAGWRGFDPTHGVAVADGHVTVAAAPDPLHTMPVSGGFAPAGDPGGDARSQLAFSLEIQASEDEAVREAR